MVKSVFIKLGRRVIPESVQRGILNAVFAFVSIALVALASSARADDADGRALIRQGLALLKSSDHADAVRRFDAAFQAGHPDAGYYLGRMLEHGLGVEKDFSRAYALYRFAIDQGSAKALNRVGVFEIEGRHLTKNVAHGAELICRAARMGDPDGLYSCANLLLDGTGVARNVAVGLRLLNDAAKLGHVAASNQLGLTYLHGRGVRKNLRRARQHFEFAASHANPIGLFELGAMYDRGRAIARDPVRAHLYFTLAAVRGLERARTAADRINETLTQTQRQQSRWLALTWRATERADVFAE